MRKIRLSTQLAVWDAHDAAYGDIQEYLWDSKQHLHMMRYWMKCFSRACNAGIVFW